MPTLDEPEVCPNCGEFSNYISNNTGWCKSCTTLQANEKRAIKRGERLAKNARTCLICGGLVYGARLDSRFCKEHSIRARSMLRNRQVKYGMSLPDALADVIAYYRKKEVVKK